MNPRFDVLDALAILAYAVAGAALVAGVLASLVLVLR
jgi:hypothetical protein